MDDVARLLKTTVEELDRLLNARNVMGDPIEREGATIIPIVSFGFAFGAGGASATGGGSGAGGGIKPLGAIIIDKEGARVEGMQGATTEIARTLGGAATRLIETAVEAARGGADAATPPRGRRGKGAAADGG